MGINAEYMGSPLSAQAKATSIIASIASFSIRQKQQDVGRLKSRVWVERLGASRDPIATTTTSSSKAKQQQQHQKQAKNQAMKQLQQLNSLPRHFSVDLSRDE